MSIVLYPARLHDEMIRRGWAAADLARESNLSQATISMALAGKPIAEKSVSMIAAALLRTPANDLIDSLIMRTPTDRELH